MQAANQRFLPLDVFRGLTICFMIIVNTPGTNDIFAPLEHAAWHGFTPTDLVFPSFLFAVGNAMSFSMRKYYELGNAAVLSKIFKRTLLIFLLGFIMYWLPFVHHTDDGSLAFNSISNTRIMGVLQRIALCYCFASLMIRFLPQKAVWILSGLILIGYWLIMRFAGDPADPYGFSTNAAIHFDKLILGENHMYHDKGLISEPEGLLSTLPAIVNVVIGYYTGLYIQKRRPNTLSILIRVGCFFIILATFWNMEFPINKKLWTSTFVLLTAGLDLLILTLLLYIIDIKEKTSWTGFFTTFGKKSFIPLSFVRSDGYIPLFLYYWERICICLDQQPPIPAISPR